MGDSLLDLNLTPSFKDVINFFWVLFISFLKFLFITSLIIFLIWFIYYVLVIIAKKVNQCGIENKSFLAKKMGDFIALVNPIIIIIPNVIYRILKKLHSFI